MGRILGLDIGKRRIGIAVSDETHTIAMALEPIEGRGILRSIDRIKEIAAENDIEGIVVGLPLNMDGSTGSAAEKALDFIERLKAPAGVPISAFDERLTTKQGESVLIKAGMSRRKRKAKIDGLSAVIMLQAYLDSIK